MGKRTQRLRRRLSGVTELFGSDTTVDPEAYSRSGDELYTADYDVTRVDEDLQSFYEEYQSNPFLARPINAIIDEVVEAGWWVTADSEETAEELEEFCKNITIEAGQTHRGLTDLSRTAVRQYLVRGTFLGEKVQDDQGRHVAVNPINADTVEIYTRPNQAILLPPDFDEQPGDETLTYTDDNEVAAYVQYDETLARWKHRQERHFARDEIIHWARNPDVGEVFGDSVVQPVYERAVALRQKLEDNDQAITMKAWPMVMFQLGTPEHPFTEEEQEEFMATYKEQNFGPGVYHGVPGDVDIEEFAGETADIEEHVRTDVNYIVAGMPGPKFTIGTFDDDIADSVAKAQERLAKKTVRTLRRDLEDNLTPYLAEVAESWGYDNSGVQLHVGRPKGEVAPEDVNGSTIRYTSDASGDDGVGVGGESGKTDGKAGTADDESKSTAGTRRGPSVKPDPEQGSLADDAGAEATPAVARLARPEFSADEWQTAELADPRLVSTTAEEEAMADAVAGSLIQARSAVLTALEEEGTVRAETGSIVDYVLRVGRDRRRADDLRSLVAANLTDVVSATLDTLSQDTHSPGITVRFTKRHNERVQDAADQFIRDVDGLLREIGEEIGRQLRLVDDDPQSVANALERVRNRYSDASLEQRAQLFARMHAQEVLNRTKLEEYRRADSVRGVEITNPCTDATTQLCEDLAGCEDGEPARAMFDIETSIGRQIASDTNHDPPAGFDPIGIPPFHYNCRSELVAVTASDIAQRND